MPTPLRNLLTLRFSLRAMLVVITVGCLTLGWRANRYFQNQRAIKSLQENRLAVSIRRLGPKHGYASEVSFWRDVDVREIVLTPLESPLADNAAPSLWSDLSKLTPLTSLNLNGVNFPERPDGRSASYLSNATDATFLRCKCRESGFAYALEQMPRLRSLTVRDCELSSRDLTNLSTCEELQELVVHSNDIAPNTISQIGAKQLRRLALLAGSTGNEIELSEDDIAAITQMANLRELIIEGGSRLRYPISTVQQLKSCKNLQYLSLDLKDASIAELKAVKSDLAKSLPNCKLRVHRSGND
jgi:hypothetical protein